MIGTCQLCEREGCNLTDHHLIPRTLHKNKRVKEYFLITTLRETVPLCRPCHSQIHDLFTEKELGWEYNTIEKLKAHPDVQKWIEWVKDKTF
jgi:hypothetical protein